MSTVFGELWRSTDKELKRIVPVVARINELEPDLVALSDDDLQWRTVEFRQRLEQGEPLDDLLPEAFASVREVAQRTLHMRHFNEQLAGGVILHVGKCAEIATGEGKTLTATLAAYLNGLTGQGVHIVVANDYLAQRDRDLMAPLYEGLGMPVSVLLNSQPIHGRTRRIAYASDITYGTAAEFGFDYLRDHMVSELSSVVQRHHNYAILDDVDYVLIDEARTPLIITGQDDTSAEKYMRFARLVSSLKEGADYTVDSKTRTVAITEAGIDVVERQLGVDNLYNDMGLTGHLENALKAHTLFKRDKEYLVRNGTILIIDELTGRPLPGRRYTEGLHQALEAKEDLVIQPETHTLATITYQNYFRMYSKLAGMSGTLRTDEEEYRTTYGQDIVAVPPHLPVRRMDQPDLIYTTQHGKLLGVVEEVRDRNQVGQPVLVGTPTIEASEEISALLNEARIHHSVLNARYHEQEAHIIAQAGRTGAVTVISNMAGRGTDIHLGGDPKGHVDDILRERDIDPEFATASDREEALGEAERRCAEDHEHVVALGGLYVIGTEHHESRRMDRQLRGRSGRQGDPGESRFFVSLQDELMRRFNADRVAGIMTRIGMDGETPIESRAVTGMIEQAQIKVEAHDFDVRQRLKAFDDEITAQSNIVYQERQVILEQTDMHGRILDMIEHETRRRVAEHTAASPPKNWDKGALGKALEPWGVHIPEDILPDDIDQLERETLASAVAEAAREKYEAKEREVIAAANAHHAVEPGEVFMRQFERIVLLHVLDSLWRDHIDRLDVIRSGIDLRRFAQRDPLVEFKREAFDAFEKFKIEVERVVTEYALRSPVKIVLPPPQSPSPSEAGTRRPLTGDAPRPALAWLEPLIAALNEPVAMSEE